MVQWEAPDAVAPDIHSVLKTGARIKDSALSDKAPNISRILIEPAKATVERFSL